MFILISIDIILNFYIFKCIINASFVLNDLHSLKSNEIIKVLSY